MWNYILPFVEVEGIKPLYLLLFLGFLKTYGTVDILMVKFSFSKGTIEHYISLLRGLFFSRLNESLFLEKWTSHVLQQRDLY